MGRVKEGRGTLLGNAGEHYVVAELLRRDIIAAQAPRNAPGLDVPATTGSRSVNVRIKTRSEEAESWVWMVKKDGTIFLNLQDKRDFVALVRIAETEPPQYWIVPTPVLDRELRRLHAEWLRARARRSGPQRQSGTAVWEYSARSGMAGTVQATLGPDPGGVGSLVADPSVRTDRAPLVRGLLNFASCVTGRTACYVRNVARTRCRWARRSATSVVNCRL